MGKPSNYLHEEDDAEYFGSDDFEAGDSPEPETRRREKPQPRHGARQRLDSRKEDLWLKQQLNDWGDEFEDADRAD
jgi:hypothetical protein